MCQKSFLFTIKLTFYFIYCYCHSFSITSAYFSSVMLHEKFADVYVFKNRVCLVFKVVIVVLMKYTLPLFVLFLFFIFIFIFIFFCYLDNEWNRYLFRLFRIFFTFCIENDFKCLRLDFSIQSDCTSAKVHRRFFNIVKDSLVLFVSCCFFLLFFSGQKLFFCSQHRL